MSLVKSKQRVADHGEVFTPSWMVEAMLFAKTAAKSVACLQAGFEDAMTVMELPEKYRKRLRSTNMQERLSQRKVGIHVGILSMSGAVTLYKSER